MRILSTFFIIFHLVPTQAQRNLPKNFNALNINASFGLQIPAADLSLRFSDNLGVGGGIEYVKVPSGWAFGFHAQYLFGQEVKEDVLAKIRTTDGNIMGEINNYADVVLRMRGLYTGGSVAKIIKLHDNGNRFGGIRVALGGGWLNHHIRIQDNTQGSVPHLEAAYAKGYDRWTSGIAFTQFIGYQMVSRDRTFNFFVGFEATEGFTRNRRGYNFDTMQRDDLKRHDILYGVRVGWSLPIFTNVNADELEY
ncbi:MAG: hypothetical protein JNL70_03790 [Saprospiraceae bacterium]|nr:hypothetical protein [Saprospiraceae bacterium]